MLIEQDKMVKSCKFTKVLNFRMNLINLILNRLNSTQLGTKSVYKHCFIIIKSSCNYTPQSLYENHP